MEMRDIAMDGLLELIADIKAAREQGITGEALASAQNFHRKASFLLDFAEAENSMGFHAPQESSRILLKALEYVRQGQNIMRGTAQPAAAVSTTAETVGSVGAGEAVAAN